MTTTTHEHACDQCARTFDREHGLRMHKIRAHRPGKTWSSRKPANDSETSAAAAAAADGLDDKILAHLRKHGPVTDTANFLAAAVALNIGHKWPRHVALALDRLEVAGRVRVTGNPRARTVEAVPFDGLTHHQARKKPARPPAADETPATPPDVPAAPPDAPTVGDQELVVLERAPVTLEAELAALGALCRAHDTASQLPLEARARILRYIIDRYGDPTT